MKRNISFSLNYLVFPENTRSDSHTFSNKNVEPFICLFLDFKMAFDRVWQTGLPVKMTQLGINDKLIVLTYSFLFKQRFHCPLQRIHHGTRVSLRSRGLSQSYNPIHLDLSSRLSRKVVHVAQKPLVFMNPHKHLLHLTNTSANTIF